MFIKYARMKIEANSVVDRDMLLFNPRKAFIKHDISEELIHASNGLDIVAELQDRNPEEWVIFRARAIDAGGSETTGEHYFGANDNGDYFSEEELLKEADGCNGLKSFETFINVPLFTNHQNDDVEKARGKIVNSFYDKKNHCIYVDAMIDAKAYPELARGIREGYISDCSMGCSVQWSECSICGNSAIKEEDYCSHIRNHKGKKLGGKDVYEKNHGIKFIELSAVTDGACENCTIQNVYSGPELLQKLEDNLSKTVLSICNDIKNVVVAKKLGFVKTASLNKEARGEDVDKLNKALDYLREVADQILDSKAVDFEFLENIGSVLADLQKLIVDLVESGFANEGGTPTEGAPEGAPTPEVPPQAPAPEAPPATPPAGAPASGGPAPAVPPPAPAGTMPMQQPQLASVSSEKMEKYSKGLQELNVELKDIIQGLSIIKEKIAGGDENMPTKKQTRRAATTTILSEKFADLVDERIQENEPVAINHGSYSIVIDPDKGISGYVNNKQVVSANLEELGDETLLAAKLSPEVVAGRLIEVVASRYDENGEIKMGSSNKKNVKEAIISELEGSGISTPPVDQVQEGTLADLNGNWSRKNDPQEATNQVGEITEGQLESVPKSVETGKGDWNRVRPDDDKENLSVTEGQLGERPDATNYPGKRKIDEAASSSGQLGEVQEGQFANYNDPKDGDSAGRWHDSDTPGDYIPITEGQFEGKDRWGNAVDEITEGQLGEQHRWGGEGSVASDASPHRASKADRIITAIVNGFANAVLSSKIPAKSFIKAEAGFVAPGQSKAYKVAGKWTENGIRKVAEQFIKEELKNHITSEESKIETDINDALAVVYEDPSTLEAAIDNAIKTKIAEMQNISNSETETVEAEKKASYHNALKKAAANLEDVQSNTTTLSFSLAEAGIVPGADVHDNSNQLNIKKFIAQVLSKSKKENVDPATLNITDLHVGEDGNVKAVTEYRTTTNHKYDPSTYDAHVNKVNLENPQVTNEIPQTQPTESVQPEVETEAPVAVVAEKVDKLKKLAQSPAGTTMPTPAPDMGAPGAPPAGVESLTTPSPDAVTDDVGIDTDIESIDDVDGEPKAPGSVCPLCGDTDVDVVEGKMNCNNCGGQYEVEVNWKLLNLPDEYDMDISQRQSGEDEEEIAGEGDDLAPTDGEAINDQLGAPGEGGLPAPGGAPAPAGGGGAGGGGLPMGHSNGWLRTSMKINSVALVQLKPLKFASVGDVAAPGQRCPSCGSSKVAFKESSGSCTACGTGYKVAFKKKDSDLLAQIDWTPNIALAETNKTVKLEDGTEVDLGRAVKGNMPEADKEAVKAELHKILSSRQTMLKMAHNADQNGEGDEMVFCQLDQCGKGYTGEDAFAICSAARDEVLGIKSAQFEDDDEKDDENDNGDNGDNGDDPDQDTYNNSDNNEDVDNVEFEGEDDLVEITDELEDDPADIPGEDGEMVEAPKVQKIELYMEDANGEQFEVEYDVSGLEPETIEDPADFDEPATARRR